MSGLQVIFQSHTLIVQHYFLSTESTKRGNTNFSELLAKRLKSQIAQVSSLPVVPSEKKAKPVSISDVFEVVSEARPPNQVAPGQIITLTPVSCARISTAWVLL